MPTTFVNDHYDTAFIALYVFWIAFVALIYYLRREDRREGFPLIRGEKADLQGYLSPIPDRKAYPMPDGTIALMGRPDRDVGNKLIKTEPWFGAPYTPAGNPLADGVGPAAWCERSDKPDRMTEDGSAKIVPLRISNGYSLFDTDPDPRGFWLISADRKTAGTIVECWVDRAEHLVRYLEAEVAGPTGLRRVLIPMDGTSIDVKKRQVKVNSLLASQIAEAPGVARPDSVTLLEEDKIVAYFAGGYMYATPQRIGPYL